MKVAIYTRISQARHGTVAGVERQEADCRARAEAEGWTVVRVYSDNNASAYAQKKRPQFLALCAAAERREFHGILVYSSDRLWRVASDLEDLLDLVKRTKVQILSCVSGNIDLSTSDGRTKARVYGALAQGESEKMAERVRRQKLEAARGGSWGGGSRPYGYRVVKVEGKGSTRLEVDEAEAAVIREMAERVLSGERLLRVLRDMNARGVTTSTGKPWRYRTAHEMLRGPLTAGLRQHHDELYEADWTPILSRDQWARLAALLQPTPRQGTPTRHLLTGLVVCRDCGARMMGHLRDGRREYRAGMSHLEAGCGRRIAGQLDDFVVAQVLRLLGTHLSYFLPHVVEDIPEDPSTYQAKIEELANDYYVRGTMAKSTFERTMEALEAAREAAHESVLRAAAASPLTTLHDVDDIERAWSHLTFDQQRAVLVAVVESIEVGRAVRGRNRFDPTRVRLLTKAAQIGPKLPQPEPEDGFWIWDPTEDRFTHEGVFVMPSLPALMIEVGSVVPRLIPRAGAQERAASTKPVGDSAPTPRFRRGPKAASEAAVDDDGSRPG